MTTTDNNKPLPGYATKSSAAIDMNQYALDLTSNQEYAIKAIRSRNLRIKCLEMEKKHILVVYKELADKIDQYTMHSDINNKEIELLRKELESLTNKNETLLSEKQKLEGYIQELMKIYDQTEKKSELFEQKVQLYEKQENRWQDAVDSVVSKLPRPLSGLVAFALNPLLTRYFLVCLFVLLFIASVIGWGTIGHGILKILPLFGT